MITPNYHKEPWKHPAVWKTHIIRMTRDHLAGVETTVATCECGWAVCARLTRYKAQDRAINDHWQAIIAEAEAVPA